MKRVMILLLVFVLVLGGIPATDLLSLTVQAAATDITKITNEADWNKFASECTPLNGREGEIIELMNDIELTAGGISSADDFKGTFNGNGHTIRIDSKDKESFFNVDGVMLGEDVGLFRNLIGSAKVENLIVWVEGTLRSSNNTTAVPEITSYGALVGRMSGNSTLQNCALVGNGTVTHEVTGSNGRSYRVGSMVGAMENTAKIDGCYSELSVKLDTDSSAIGTFSSVGGIVGNLTSTGCVVSNVAYLGPTIVANSNAAIMTGGVIGMARDNQGVTNTITNAFVKGTDIKVKHGSLGVTKLGSYSGHICGYTYLNTITNCYGKATINQPDGDITKDGYYANINSVNAKMMGDAWADTLAGFPSLKWLVAVPQSTATVNVADPANALKITPEYIDYDGTAGYVSAKDSLWKIDMEIPVKGRTAPVTADATLDKTTGGSTITSVEVKDNSSASGIHYSGLDYPFLATITGTDVVGKLDPTKLKWMVAADHDTGAITDTSGWWAPAPEKKGILSIPASFYGKVKVTASYEGTTSAAHEITVERGELSLQSKTVPAGTTVPMDLTLNASQLVLNAVDMPNVIWELGGTSTDYSISNGILTVPSSAATGSTVTVTAKIEGMKDVTAKITVGTPTTKEVTVNLAGAKDAEIVPGAETLALGESVKMTVTPHSGTTSTTVWTGDGVTDTGANTYTYKPTTAGSHIITATQTVTETTPASSTATYIAEFTITVTDGDAAILKETAKAPPTQFISGGIKGVNGSGGGTTVPDAYSITLPAPTAKTDYYYKFVDDIGAELTTVYTSRKMLVSDHAYQPYNDKIKLDVASGGTAFTQKNLLVVAVDQDVGNMLPSAVTQFILPTSLPIIPQTQIACNNLNAAVAAKNGIAKLKEGFYSNTCTDATTSTPGGLSWEKLLEKTTPPTGGIQPKDSAYIATGDIKVTAYPHKDRFGNSVTADSPFVAAVSGNGTMGEVAPKPTIYPRENGIITRGVTIDMPAGAKVFYTATADKGETPVQPSVDADGAITNETTKEYMNGNVIQFPAQAKTFVVCAVAWMKGKSISDSDYVVYKNDTNLLTPAAPTLLLNNVKYNVDATYPGDSKLIFEHIDLQRGEVLFTVNGEEPRNGNYNTKVFAATGGDGSTKFDPTHPYQMSGTSEYVTIRAKFHDNEKTLDSTTATYVVSVKQKLNTPAANIKSDSMVRPGTNLELSLSDIAITQLNTNGKIRVERTKYAAGTDDEKNFLPVATEKVTLTGDPPKEGVEYVSCYLNETTKGYELPYIRYLFGDDASKISTDGIRCTYGQRRVTSNTTIATDDKGALVTTTKVTVNYINPQPIALNGAAGTQLKVNAIAVSGLEAHSDSNVATFHYTVRSAVEAPVAFPATDPNEPAAIKVGEQIALSTGTADALIFYTTDGSTPKANYTPPTATAPGVWIAEEKTFLYDEAKSIVMENNAQLLFTVRAYAVSKDFSLESSPPVMFRYQPPAPVQAVFSSPTAGAVVANQPVSLKCTTEDSKIFYKIFTDKAPDMSDKNNIPTPYKDQIFDSTVPIVITKPTWIVSVAERNGVLSQPTVNAYTVAPQLSAPFASLKTGSVVYKGTRIRLNGSGNLAFTIDGSDPKAVIAAQAAPPAASGGTGGTGGITINTSKDDTKKAEVFYGDSVVIDADYGKSITVRAFAYGDGKSPSNTVSFTYTVCDKDKYLTVAPLAETVVTSGDDITLTTGISNGVVFYSTGSAAPTLKNSYEDSKNWDSKDAYTHYRWTAGSSTRKGNSVRVTGEPGGTFTIKATAAANGAEGGTTMVFTYPIRGKSSAPTASIPSGAVVFDGATVTLSAQDGDIFYTTDGTTPSTSSRLYSAPIPVTGSMVLKAIAVAKDKVESDAVEYLYSYADQVFAPGMSTPGGEIEQGSRITLASMTEGATIYYSTNGVDPTKDSTLYTSPITVMRPVTIKAIAIKKGLRDSAINSASYTVIEPELPPMDEEGGGQKPQTVFDGLVSRRTYFDATAGPKFSDVVLSDTVTSAVLSANEGVVPKDTKLIVKQINTSDTDQEAVRNALGYQIVTLYDVSLERDGEQIQPDGEVEIGIPIPSDYQNGVVSICRVGVDNTVEEYKPRRSGNSAYITVEGKLDRYAVTVPAMSSNSGGWSGFKIAILCAAGSLLIGTIAFLTNYFLKKRHNNVKN